MKARLRDLAKEVLQRSLRGGFVWRLPPRFINRVCLTFDDGPDPVFTPRFLDLLADHGVQATFFLLGSNVERHGELAREIVRRGHSVGTHTYGHTEITTFGDTELEQDLMRARESLRQVTGADSALFRPPRGRVSWRTIRTVVRLGYVLVHWSRTYSDFRADGTERLLARLREEPVRGRDIVLLHDNNPHTAQALAWLLPELSRKGLDLRVPLSLNGSDFR